MNTTVLDLRRIAAEAKQLQAPSEATRHLQAVEEACRSIGKSWSGSRIGYHSRVYYTNLKPPPPGHHFDRDWGFTPAMGNGTFGDWEEFEPDDVKAAVWATAEVHDLTAEQQMADEFAEAFEDARADVVSVLSAYLATVSDALIKEILVEAGSLELRTARAIEKAVMTGPVASRDSTAISQGLRLGPHEEIAVQAMAIEKAFDACITLGKLAERAANHIERIEGSRARQGQEAVAAAAGDRVFIGHGRSPLWRELKDFVRDRLGLDHDEFNRVPVAGHTNIARLSEMLDNAAIALIVLTAEDETTDGQERARENVVHEAGLFQGRLGFSRAVLLLEEGCNEFSNVQGLGQIRFPRGKIGAAFEEVRAVLEREGIIES